MHQREPHLSEALTSQLRWQVGRPESTVFDLLLQRRDHGVELLARELIEDGLNRPDLLADERLHPPEPLPELRLGREVPRHGELNLCHAARSMAVVLPQPARRAQGGADSSGDGGRLWAFFW